MSHDPKVPTFWHTAPGILTAVAALLTALTGSFLALHQTGLLDRPLQASTAEVSTTPGDVAGGSDASSLASSAQTSGGPASRRSAIGLEMESVTLGTNRYEFLDVAAEIRSPESMGIAITVRMFNDSRFPAGLTNDAFRLLVDGIPRAPTGSLYKVVDGLSADEGVVQFIIPREARTLVLQMRAGEEVALIPIRR